MPQEARRKPVWISTDRNPANDAPFWLYHPTFAIRPGGDVVRAEPAEFPRDDSYLRTIGHTPCPHWRPILRDWLIMSATPSWYRRIGSWQRLDISGGSLSGMIPWFNSSALMTLDGNVTTRENEPLSKLNVRVVQIGNITVPFSIDEKFCVSDAGHETCSSTQSVLRSDVTLSGLREWAFDFVFASARSFDPQACCVPRITTMFPVTCSPVAPPTYRRSLTIAVKSRFLSRKVLLLRIWYFQFAIWILS
jgi:hypothetical protein